MALRALSTPPFSAFSSKSNLSDFFFLRSNSRNPHSPWRLHSKSFAASSVRLSVKACVNLEEKDASDNISDWGKVSAVLFDMDGVLCNSEVLSRMAGVDVFAEMGIQVTTEDFVPFTGTGEANFLGGVASAKGVKQFNVDAAKKRFFEIYLNNYAKPNSGIGFPGALEIINECKNRGLKVAVASSADLVKVEANLGAAGLPLSLFDAIVSADAFENLKPAPDIFLAASKILNVPTNECVVIEDALAGVQAAKAAGMRCIAVTTSLSEEKLKGSGPTLIRKDISGISLDDILCGGSCSPRRRSVADVKKTQGPELNEPSMQTADTFSMLYGMDNRSFEDRSSTQDAVSTLGGLLGTRRNLLRYGSLGVAVSCLYYTITNIKAMQYASPKAIWNMLFGVDSPSFEYIEDESRSSRIKQFMEYISDLEARGSATTVPEFPRKLDWLNSAPLQLSRDLKGKVVLLDFWTYCCINCIHVLPDLEFLENKYKNMPFVVVGVHSAKFDNEKDIEAIRNAVLRYNITHPVVNDGEMNLWRELGVNSWPTFVLIGPNGKLIAQLAGEGHRKDLDDLIEAALLYYNGKNALDNKTVPLRLEKNKDNNYLTSPLKYPGKLAVDVLNDRLFISDSNHNRIVVTDLDGNFIMHINSCGEEGFRDGNFDEARFNRPQGLAYNAKKNVLYVADTENHALRIIDFVKESVGTLAGNGSKGSDYQGGRIGNDQPLNSPWDVCFDPVKDIVYIAMAGQHQIWKHNTNTGVTNAFSGDGIERNLNGTSATSTSFAQPSGISLSHDLKEAYIADSESSSIRALNLETGGSRLLAGGDPVFSDNLFKFGDHDGPGSEVLLQHPLGVFCGNDGQLYVADSYNHKIKKLDPLSRRVSTLAGTGEAGFRDGTALSAQLSEPSGIVEAENGRLYIADTNNNVIRYLNLNVEKAELQTLELKGVQPPVPNSRSFRRLQRRSSPDTEVVVLDGVSSAEGVLTLKISVPKGFHFSKEAVSKYDVEIEPEEAVVIDPSEGNLNPDGSTMLHFRRTDPSSSTGRVHCKVYYCKEDEVCLYQSVTFEVHFEEMGSVSTPAADITLAYVVKPKTVRSSLLDVGDNLR